MVLITLSLDFMKQVQCRRPNTMICGPLFEQTKQSNVLQVPAYYFGLSKVRQFQIKIDKLYPGRASSSIENSNNLGKTDIRMLPLLSG